MWEHKSATNFMLMKITQYIIFASRYNARWLPIKVYEININFDNKLVLLFVENPINLILSVWLNDFVEHPIKSSNNCNETIWTAADYGDQHMLGENY